MNIRTWKKIVVWSLSLIIGVPVCIILIVFFVYGKGTILQNIRTEKNTTSELQQLGYDSSQYVIGSESFTLFKATSSHSRERGLSFTDYLLEDEGLLFIFSKPASYGFWMKDMNYPIDIIWVSADGEVIYIEENVEPSTYPQVFYPNEHEALYVIELAAGAVRRANIEVGQKISLID